MSNNYKFTMDLSDLIAKPEEDGPNGLMSSLRPKARPTITKPQADKPPEAMTQIETLKADFANTAIATQSQEDIDDLYGKKWDDSASNLAKIRNVVLDRWTAPAKPEMPEVDASNVVTAAETSNDNRFSLEAIGELINAATAPKVKASASVYPDESDPISGSGVSIEQGRFDDDPEEATEAPKTTGIMSKPLTDDDMGLPEGPLPALPLTDDDMGLPVDPLPALNTFSTTVDALYTDFTDGGQEGTEAHIGLDAQNITLPAGIVAEGLKYDGVAVDQGSNTITAANFDKDKLDTSGAFFEIGSTKIKRSDYTTDVGFSKAVLTGFEDAAKKKAGTDWDKMSDAAKKAMLKVGWNKGAGWLGGSTAGKAYKELAKTTPSASNLYPKILTGSTLAPKDDGTIQGASIGIAKARADAMNLLKDTLAVNEITKVIADNTGTNTAFKYYDKKGTLIHTEQTDRAVTLYANGSNEKVEKNAAGEW